MPYRLAIDVELNSGLIQVELAQVNLLHHLAHSEFMLLHG